MQKYKEINGNDYVKNSRTTINETMQSIQSMNSGTAFPTNNLFEGMKCYRTDLKKTYTLTDVENNTWVEDAHATLSDEATHAASATKLQTARSLNLGGAVTADAATFDGTANATINVKTLDATKLKGTASVSTTGNAATATKVVATAAAGASANIAEATMASNDLARIRVSGATNAGELALETADDGSEPIVARQYTGAYTNAVRTAKILDESGNTSFPGTVVAPKFTGALNGNAATATKLQTARTLSLTGKAAGSATFDGSANVAINVTSVDADTASKLSTARKINITGNASGSAGFDGSGDISISTTVNESKHAANADTAANANKLASESGSNYLFINTEEDNWSVIGQNPGNWLKSIRTDVSAPPYSIGNYSTAIAFGGRDTKGIITHAYNSPDVKFAGGSGSTAGWKFTIHGGANNEFYDLNNFPTKTGNGASGTWGINISGNAASATKAGNVSGKIYYSSDSPSVATDKLFTVKQAHAGDDNVPNNGLVIQTGPTGANYNGKLYITDNGSDGVWIGGVAAGKEVGWTRLVENKGSWNINSATATKLATARAISLTGNASGSANFDGSGNVSISTTVNESKHAAAANALNSMGNKTAIKDGTREPLNLSLYQVYNNGYPVSYGNLLSIGGAGGGELLAEWSGGDKGIGHLYYRNRRDSGNLWSDWRTVAFTSDINSFSPTKTGGGASGTWGIDISGNAASATNADKVDGYHASDIINRISAANTGGIVAASLTENGYAKFANGLILQWKCGEPRRVPDSLSESRLEHRGNATDERRHEQEPLVYPDAYNDWFHHSEPAGEL